MKLLLLACGWRSGPRGGAVGAGRGTRHAADERVRRTPGTAGHHARPCRPARLKSGDDPAAQDDGPRMAPAPAGRRAGRRRRRPGRRTPPRPARAGRASPAPPRTPRPARRPPGGRPAGAAPAPRGRSGRAAAPAGVGAGVASGHRPRGPTAGWRRRGRAGRACGRRTPGNLAPPCSAYVGKLSICTRVGTSAVPRRGHRGDDVVGQAGAVLDAVDAGGDQLGHRLLAEAVRGHPRAELVRAGDRRGRDVGGPARREVAGVAVDPVADELDPAVAAARPAVSTSADQVGRLDLGAVVADVALGAGRCAGRRG